MNHFVCTGRLTADPEVKQTGSGVAICAFSLAVDRRFVNKQTGKRETDFLRCVAYRQTAEFLGKYTKKGNLLEIHGEVRQNRYKNKDGENVSTMEILVDEVKNLTPKEKATTPVYDDGFGEMEPLDDMPF